jgi:hypothetical protein
MKLTFNTLEGLFTELREQQIAVVRVAPAIHADMLRTVGGIPHLTCRVVVTARVDRGEWIEWRFQVGRAVAEVGDRGLQVPAWLQTRSDEALREVSRRVDEAGFLIREGMLTHDTAVMDAFRL